MAKLNIVSVSKIKDLRDAIHASEVQVDVHYVDGVPQFTFQEPADLIAVIESYNKLSGEK